jgi:hypothetical protein
MPNAKLICSLWILGTLLSGCDCASDTSGVGQYKVPLWSCEDKGVRPGEGDVACGGDFRYVKGSCDAARCDASELDDNCCPGQYCNNGGECAVRPAQISQCAQDSNCQVGQRCTDRPLVSKDTKTCAFTSVDSAGQCPQGGGPFNQRCLFEAPCGGGCTSGTICNIESDLCESMPSLAGDAHGCAQTCAEHTILVYSDPDTMLYERCCAIECHCEPIPTLPKGAWGSHSDAKQTQEGTIASAYNMTYGDLVVVQFDSSGNITNYEFVDGIPSTGDIVGAPTGHRRGIAEPGEDVGQYTSLALDSQGQARVAYYDRSQQALKFAAYDASTSTWAISYIDDGSLLADAGRFVSLVLDSSDRAHVTYLADGQDGTYGKERGLKYARSQNTTPEAPADWTAAWVDVQRGCQGQCLGDEICVDLQGVPTCTPPAQPDACSDCSCDQACVTHDGNSTCQTTMPHFIGSPCLEQECEEGEICVSDSDGATSCVSTVANDSTLCSAVCGDEAACVADGAGGGLCKRKLPVSVFDDLPINVGLYADLILDADIPKVVYYDSFRQQLRGALALFNTQGAIDSGFSTGVVQCGATEDVGAHASLAHSANAQGLGVAFQEKDGKSLLYRNLKNDFFDTPQSPQTFERVDDGVRQSSVSLVGAYADLAYGSSGAGYIAYADQGTNDLMLAHNVGGSWRHQALATNGAYGGFANILSLQENNSTLTIVVSSLLRAYDGFDRDVSHLVVQEFTELSLSP